MKQSNSEISKIKATYIISMIVIMLIISMSFLYCVFGEIYRLKADYIRDISIDIMGMVLCGILIFSLSHDKPWDKQNRSLFRLIFVVCLLFHFDEASSFMEGQPNAAHGLVFINTLLYMLETLLAWCFWIYVREELKVDGKRVKTANTICLIALSINWILDILNYRLGFFFEINSVADYVPGKFEWFSNITTFIIYLTALYVIVIDKKHSVKEKLILLTFQIFPITAHVAELITKDYAVVYPTYLFATMLIYINVFSLRSKKVLEQKVELDKQRAQLMISQIQPHFLYNVLTTISNLCVTDPEEAEETTVLFSQYLRTNLDSLRKTEPVPFSVELGHINTYIELEKKRFKEKLNTSIDCPEKGFLVPALGLQPIVENSIKHGIRGKDTPGTLYIRSRRVDEGYEVVIEDDGVGFDMNAPVPQDGRSHVGMVNVKSRLEQMCDAKVTVESSPGKGCRTTILFPQIPNKNA